MGKKPDEVEVPPPVGPCLSRPPPAPGPPAPREPPTWIDPCLSPAPDEEDEGAPKKGALGLQPPSELGRRATLERLSGRLPPDVKERLGLGTKEGPR